MVYNPVYTNGSIDFGGATDNQFAFTVTNHTGTTTTGSFDLNNTTGTTANTWTTGWDTQEINWLNTRLDTNAGTASWRIETNKIKLALMQIFQKVPKSLKKQMTPEERQLLKAKYKSEKLIRQWLSPDEYRALVVDGEVEMPSAEEDDTIFIVKRDPIAMVDVKKKGEYSHKLCLVAEDMEYPIGDQLLSKILLLKTDEKRFKEIAIRHD